MTPESVCIVMLSAIGDAVHVLPVANALKRAWPGTRITWVIQPQAHALVAGHRAIDEFVVFRRRRGLAAWESYHELRGALPERRFDLVLALQVYLKAGLATSLVHGDRKLGFDRTRARDLNWLFTNERIAFHGQRHVQDQYFEFLEHLGVDPHPVSWDIPISAAERDAQRAFYARLDRPACALVVGTSNPEKNWTAAGWARVVEAVEEEHGMRALLVGGPSASERAIADDVLRLTRGRPLDLLGDDLRRLLWLIDGSALVVSPDTGPLHIARALEVPVVGLFGYTNPKRTGPWQLFQDLVVDGYAAFRGEDYPITPAHRDGMGRVTPEAVLEKISLARKRYPE